MEKHVLRNLTSLYMNNRNTELLIIYIENRVVCYCSLNCTSAAFLEHHTVDIVLRYRGSHISSIGSIDNQYSAFVTKMSVLVNQSISNWL